MRATLAKARERTDDYARYFTKNVRSIDNMPPDDVYYR